MNENVLELSERCRTCVYCLLRPDMKNVWYCVKNNFAIFDIDQCCSKYLRRNIQDEIRRD